MIAGSKAKTQIVLESKLVLARGDNFVLRRNDITIGGGIILDSHARRHKRHDQTTIQRLNTILDPTDIETFVQFLRQIVPITVLKLSKQLGLPFADVVKSISSIHSSSFASEIYILHPNNQHDAINADTILVDQSSWNRAKTTIIETVTQFHKANPSKRGIDTESLYKKIAIQRDLAIAALEDLISSKCLVLEQSSISVPNYYPSLDPLKSASAESLIQHLIKEPFSPPSLDTIEEDVVTFLIESNKVERVGGAILFESNTHKSIVSKILEEITIRGSITVGEVRDLFSTSRKFALAILEDLDQRGLTQRVGDTRKLR
jgi:selenocysteine-specific elongation factor